MVVDDQIVLTGVPVTYLLFLEKQLVDIQTFVEKFPTLDPSERWRYDAATDSYASDAVQSIKTKKVMKTHVKYEATVQHPAQTETYNEDQTVGRWTTVKFSGAIPAKDKNDMLARVRKMQEAVKIAREEANSLEVEHMRVGDSVFNYVFGK